MISKTEACKENMRFPVGCGGCEHFVCYDMSIDDFTNICTRYNKQIDDCDASYCDEEPMIFYPDCHSKKHHEM